MSNKESDIVTHARVKYIQDDHIKFIPVNHVKEFIKKSPETKEDFDKDKIYAGFWQDKLNPDGVWLPIIISDLACKYCFHKTLNIYFLSIVKRINYRNK